MIKFIFVDLLSKVQILLMENLTFFKISEISGFQTFISGGFISSKKCPIFMVDPALNSLDSELFNAPFDVITAFFPAALSRKKLGYPLEIQSLGNASDPLHLCFFTSFHFSNLVNFQSFANSPLSSIKIPCTIGPKLFGCPFPQY